MSTKNAATVKKSLKAVGSLRCEGFVVTFLWHFCKCGKTRSCSSADTVWPGQPLGLDGSDGSRDLATLTFDLGGHGACD